MTWEGLLTIFNVGLQDGGPAGLVYGFLFCWAGYTAVVASLAELTSRFPTAGGQYHWTYDLAPPKYRNFLSWITGQYWPVHLRAEESKWRLTINTRLASRVRVAGRSSCYLLPRWHHHSRHDSYELPRLQFPAMARNTAPLVYDHSRRCL